MQKLQATDFRTKDHFVEVKVKLPMCWTIYHAIKLSCA